MTGGRGKSARSLRLIEAARDILEEIQPASVRAVCYQLFNAKLIASMAKGETNRVSTQLRDARETGVIPWSWIVDETREPERIAAWENPIEYCETVKRSYRRDRWQDQPCRIEVWSEKGTIRGTLAPVLARYGVTFRVMHGYGSATSVYQVACESVGEDKPLMAFYLGDWDPSGLHMSQVDLPGRLTRYGGDVELVRLALSPEDVEAGGLPSFSIDEKRRDPRYRWFLEQYGRRCWELDALSPVLLRARVEAAIEHRLDTGAWARADRVEQAELDSLMTILSRWPVKARAGISRQAPKC